MPKIINKHAMGLDVTEDELRLYLLCSNPDRIDMDKVRSLTPTKGPAKRSKPSKTAAKPAPPSDDDFDFTRAVRQYRGDAKRSGSEGKDRPPRLSDRMKKAKAPKVPAAVPASDSSSESDAAEAVRHEVQKRMTAIEWQQLHAEISALIRATGSSIKPPKAGTPITDMRRIKDYLAKEHDIPQSVEATLNFFINLAPMIEKFVTSNLPFVKLQGWASVLQAARNFLRGPLESIYRTQMMSFGYTMSPMATIAIILGGSVVVTWVANQCGANPGAMASSALNNFGGVLGLTSRPPPEQRPSAANVTAQPFSSSASSSASSAAAPSRAPPPPPSFAPQAFSAPSAFGSTPSASPSQGPSRPTLEPPPF